jgi:hypothetical protein
MNELTYVMTEMDTVTNDYGWFTYGRTAWVYVGGRIRFAVHPKSNRDEHVHVVMLTDNKDEDGANLIASLFMSPDGMHGNLVTLAQLYPPF